MDILFFKPISAYFQKYLKIQKTVKLQQRKMGGGNTWAPSDPPSFVVVCASEFPFRDPSGEWFVLNEDKQCGFQHYDMSPKLSPHAAGKKKKNWSSASSLMKAIRAHSGDPLQRGWVERGFSATWVIMDTAHPNATKYQQLLNPRYPSEATTRGLKMSRQRLAEEMGRGELFHVDEVHMWSTGTPCSLHEHSHLHSSDTRQLWNIYIKKMVVQ